MAMEFWLVVALMVASAAGWKICFFLGIANNAGSLEGVLERVWEGIARCQGID